MKLKTYFDTVKDCYRQRDVWAWLRKREKAVLLELLPSPHRELKTLEVVTGSGFYTSLLMDRGVAPLTCVDLRSRNLKQIPFQGVRKFSGDFLSAEISDTFDLIVCCGGMDMSISMQEFLMKCRRISGPGAQLVLLVPLLGPWSWLYQMHALRKGVVMKFFEPKYLQWLASTCGWKMEAQKSLLGFVFAARFRSTL